VLAHQRLPPLRNHPRYADCGGDDSSNQGGNRCAVEYDKVNSVQDRFESAVGDLPGTLPVSRPASLFGRLIADTGCNLTALACYGCGGSTTARNLSLLALRLVATAGL
jgi:hypothetical protein